MKKVLLLVVACMLAGACSQLGDQKGEYVAKVGDTAITKKDLQQEMESLPPMAKEFFKGPEGMTRFVDELVKKELLYLEAKKRGLDKAEDFQRRMEEFRKYTLINQLLEKEIESLGKITDTDVKNYYEQHKDEFVVPNQVRISHIITKTEDEARKVFERLQAGEDFAKVAAEASIDKATAKSGGDLGMFKRGEMNAQLENVAFRLRKGQVSAPVELKDGFHIIKVTDVKGPTVEFDKVKQTISQRLSAEKQREGFDKFIEDLKKNYKIELNKDAIAKLNFAQPPQGDQGEKAGPAK